MRPKKPPPPDAMRQLATHYDLAELQIDISVFTDGVLLAVAPETEFILMTARGARQLAEWLVKAAAALEKKQNG